MNYTIAWKRAAIDSCARFIGPDGRDQLEILLAAIGALGQDPQLPTSRPWGHSDYRRLHAGVWRVLYRTDRSQRTITITHIGKVPA